MNLNIHLPSAIMAIPVLLSLFKPLAPDIKSTVDPSGDDTNNIIMDKDITILCKRDDPMQQDMLGVGAYKNPEFS